MSLPGSTSGDGLDSMLRRDYGLVQPHLESAVSHQTSPPLAGVKGVTPTTYPGALDPLHGDPDAPTKHYPRAATIHRVSLNPRLQSLHAAGYVNPNESSVLFAWH